MREEIEKFQDITSQVWNNVYMEYESGAPVGIQYPTEALVIFLSTQLKGKRPSEYFDDKGKEYSMRNNFSGNALEIGFSTVANLKMASEKGYRCFGLEVSKEAVFRGNAFIKKQGLKKIKLSYWKPHRIPFRDNYFNLVYGLQCIYYNLSLEDVIDEIYRVLAPKGVFLFSFFSPSHSYMKYAQKTSEGIYRWSDQHPNPRLCGAHFRRFNSKKEILRLFSRFTNVGIFTTESDQTPLFESWWYVRGNKPNEL